MRFYNTLNRKREEFKEIHKGKVLMYTCGPTVYDYAHIGNLRSYVFEDLLKRYLKWKGYKVKHIMNITDVDDKTIKGSQEKKISLKKFTEEYEKEFFKDLESLNIEKADKTPKATEHIHDMVKAVKVLMKKGFAYKSNDGIYYKISKFENYGQLANLDVKGLKTSERVKSDEYDKENVRDFVLWKFWSKSDGSVFWRTTIGKGRPGWHIECSVMSQKYLGEGFDIHCGGVDLIFPHHTNEIAQAEAISGKKFVNYWLHNEHLLVDGKKMSKSLGNYFTLKDLEEFSWRAIRYELLTTHYRQQLNLSKQSLISSGEAVEKLRDFLVYLDRKNGKDEFSVVKFRKDFEQAMDDDLNISKALGVIFDFISEANKVDLSKDSAREIKETILDFDKVLGLKLDDSVKIPIKVKKLAEDREKARKGKDFTKADKLRKDIEKLGFLIDDVKKGYILKKKGF